MGCWHSAGRAGSLCGADRQRDTSSAEGTEFLGARTYWYSAGRVHLAYSDSITPLGERFQPTGDHYDESADAHTRAEETCGAAARA